MVYERALKPEVGKYGFSIPGLIKVLGVTSDSDGRIVIVYSGKYGVEDKFISIQILMAGDEIIDNFEYLGSVSPSTILFHIFMDES